jgi:hypothetical protein
MRQLNATNSPGLWRALLDYAERTKPTFRTSLVVFTNI